MFYAVLAFTDLRQSYGNFKCSYDFLRSLNQGLSQTFDDHMFYVHVTYPFATTYQTYYHAENSSNHPTMFMEEHNILRSMRSGFCVYDSRGLDYDHVEDGLEEVTQWMTDGVHHNQLCVRSGEESFMENDAEIVASMRSSSRFMKRRVNCAMVVANVAEIYRALKAGDWKPLEATKELFLSPALRRCSKFTVHSLWFNYHSA